MILELNYTILIKVDNKKQKKVIKNCFNQAFFIELVEFII